MSDAAPTEPTALARLLHWTQRRLLWLLLSCYLLGALLPGPGAQLRHVSVGALHVGRGSLELSAPLLLLAFLLFNAGLGARVQELRQLLRRPGLIAAGLAANFALPVAFAFAVISALRAWPEPDETQNILVGLALIGAMPIAGASTAWAQNADGNVALSLGLVLASTLLSPVLTPFVLRALQPLGSGDYGEDLGELAESGTQLFLTAAVVVPSLAGIAVRQLIPTAHFRRVHPATKLANLLVLLLLNYSNAALSLPGILREPDLDFLALVAAIVAGLCALAFWLGAFIARALRGSDADVLALMFGLGMNNNCTGLVLAASALGDHPLVMIPILFYNLIQQIAAGVVDRRARERSLTASPS